MKHRVANLECVNCGREIPIEAPFDAEIVVDCVCGAHFKGKRDPDGNGVTFNFRGEGWNWKVISVLAAAISIFFVAGFVVGFAVCVCIK